MIYLELEPRKKFDAVVFLLMLLAVLVTYCCSCTPQKRLSRLLRNHPELQHHDSTTVIKNDSIKKIADFVVAPVDSGVANIDPLFIEFDNSVRAVDTAKYQRVIDSLTTVLKAKVKSYIINRPVIKDTIIRHFEDSLTVKLWQVGQEIEVSVTKPAYVIPHVEKTVDNTISADPCETAWYDYFFRGWFVVTLLLTAFGIYRYASARV